MSDWSEAQIISLGAVIQADAEEAAAAWRQDAPQLAKPLLDAVEETND